MKIRAATGADVEAHRFYERVGFRRMKTQLVLALEV